MATQPLSKMPDAMAAFYGQPNFEERQRLDFSTVLSAATNLSNSEKEVVEVLHSLMQTSQYQENSILRSNVVEQQAPKKEKLINVPVCMTGYMEETKKLINTEMANKMAVLARASAAVQLIELEEKKKRKRNPKTNRSANPLKRTMSMSSMTSNASTISYDSSQSSKRVRVATEKAAAAVSSDIDSGEDAWHPPASFSSVKKKKDVKSRYSAFRKASSCPFCKEIGLNCGKVAAKCPNRPCNQCGRRHRLNRCRKMCCKACGSQDHSTGKCPTKLAGIERVQRQKPEPTQATLVPPSF